MVTPADGRRKLIRVLAGNMVALAACAGQRPPGFTQILPRGEIPSIDQPDWVGADAADVPDDAWVLGVIIEGQPRALSINLLNAHEIVNDKIGDTAYAAVW